MPPKNLLIVESPNKVKKIQSILGDNWTVHASKGHIMNLPANELGIDLQTLKPNLEFIPDVIFNGKKFDGGKKRISFIKSQLNGCYVYLATDPDREGEAISANLKSALYLKEENYSRITFTEITKAAIEKAITKPRKIDYCLVKAQEARRVLDRLFGYLVSPLVTKLLNKNLSAGRVQSVAMRLLVDLEERINTFKSIEHFSVVVDFDGKWCAELLLKSVLPNSDKYLTDKSLAESIAKEQQFKIIKTENHHSFISPPGSFSTSDLLQAASIKLKYVPGKTTKLAQKLFEAGHITYIRTDQVNISDDAIKEITAYAEKNNITLVDHPRKFKTKGNAQEAHEAIRPTHIDIVDAGETTEEKELYKLIWQRTLASQLPDAEYSVNQLLLETDEGYLFEAKGRQLINSGWMSVTSGDDTQEEIEDHKEINVPLLEEGTVIRGISKVITKHTQPPNRLSEAALIKKLESEGIGRPATYSSIIQNIIDREYVKTDKGKLVPTSIGIELIKTLLSANFSFMEISYTRQLEEELDDITNNKKQYIDVVGPAYEKLTQEIKKCEIELTDKIKPIAPLYECPKCQSNLRRFLNKKSSQYFWSCSNESCSNTMDDDNGKPMAKLVNTCPKCKNSTLQRNKSKYNNFYWRCKTDGCSHIMIDINGTPTELPVCSCEKCNSDLKRYEKKPPKKGFGWFCTNADCKTFMDDDNGKPVAQKR